MYCDYAATTPLTKEVKEYVISILDDFGNPSSVYSLGDTTRKIINKARDNVRKFINAEEESEIYFTPSGSASNMLAVNGFIENYDCDAFFSSLLHKSLNLYREEYNVAHRDTTIRMIPVNKVGELNIGLLALQMSVCRPSRRIPFVVVEYANSEIGTIQDIKAIADLVHMNEGILYVDCTGAIGSIPIDVQTFGADMIGFSAHKLGALKGCGVLYMSAKMVSEYDLKPIIFGSQESGKVGGTENIIGIAAIGKAVENYKYQNLSDEIRNEVFDYIKTNGWILAGSRTNRLPNNFYFAVPNRNGAEMMTLLDTRDDIQVSTGSACSAGDAEPSYALVMIGAPKELLHSYIRVTFHGDETRDQVIDVFNRIKKESEYGKVH